MAVLAKHPDGPRSIVLSPHLVGRSRLANLRMSEPTVSGEHAVLRWTGRDWELHDLGSRNGTIVDGRRLAPGERVVLARGALIAFGQADNAWQLIDDAPPTIMAMPVSGAEPLVARNHLLALPSEDDPEAVVYRDPAGDWVLEQGGETTRVTDGATVRASGREFTLRVPDLIAATWDNSSPAPHLAALTLRFSVSRDEEYVALTARGDHHVIDLGARAHHMVLLTLARSRLEDRNARGAGERSALPESSDGWVYLDELADKLGMDETHLNVAVFRCRRQLAEAGIIDAARIIERRRPTREVRLGVSRIEIVTV
ncbi:MAG TPA: FHA domain-containing protein [Kofleriaceae bacterium]|nr:FHA domain-containing protein [Kofleriaceae bacterium]